MGPLSGPSEAHRAKNGKFTQSYWPIVAAGRQSSADTQFIPQDPPRVTAGESSIWERGAPAPAETAGSNTEPTGAASK